MNLRENDRVACIEVIDGQNGYSESHEDLMVGGAVAERQERLGVTTEATASPTLPLAGGGLGMGVFCSLTSAVSGMLPRPAAARRATRSAAVTVTARQTAYAPATPRTAPSAADGQPSLGGVGDASPFSVEIPANRKANASGIAIQATLQAAFLSMRR